MLVALFDPGHMHHDAAHGWFARNQKHGSATCPLTLNGCVRVLANPKYPIVPIAPEQLIVLLRTMCANPYHEFWPDSVSLLDDTLFKPPFIMGHRMITDVYLLGLAVRRHGKLATFDRGIALRAVVGASLRDTLK